MDNQLNQQPNLNQQSDNKNDLIKKVLFVFVIIALLYLIYYSYNQFIKNSKTKVNKKNKNKKNDEDEDEDEDEDNFDLKDILNKLSEKQKNIFSKMKVN